MTKKFRVWDQKTLTTQYIKLSNMLNKIVEVSQESETDIINLPKTVIPTHIMYDVAVCYVAMYEKLVQDGLLNAGFPKNTNTLH